MLPVVDSEKIRLVCGQIVYDKKYEGKLLFKNINTASVTRVHSTFIDVCDLCKQGRVILTSHGKPNKNGSEDSGHKSRNIRITCPCDLYSLTPHFNIAELVCTGVYIFSYFCSKT